MDNGRKECAFLWYIENYTYCLLKNEEWLLSPEFTFHELEGPFWKLCLCPRGIDNTCTDDISLFLIRSSDDVGPEVFSVKCELSLLAADGSTLHSGGLEIASSRGAKNGWKTFIQKDEVLLRERSEYLPKDTLSVRCKMWKGEGDIQSTEQISARTCIVTEQISFCHAVGGFSTLQPNLAQTIEIQSHVIHTSLISCGLYYTDGSCDEKEIVIEIVSNGNQVLHKCEMFCKEYSSNKTRFIDCGEIDYGHEVQSRFLSELRLSLTREDVLSRKFEYLNNDTLTVIGQCTFSTGLINQRIEETRHELVTVMKQITNHPDNKNVFKAEGKLPGCPTAVEDIKALYISQRLSDVEVKTETKSFPAHKLVLCVKSPVFEAMLTSDMKEKNTACIQIDDLDNDVVEKLLLFLYSDSLENLQWKSAAQLYYAANKYQISKLKAICSSFLIENLNTSNASELLLLTDTHNDTDLKKSVEDFILKNEEQIFGLNQWETFIETNPQLAAKTMHLKYKRKQISKLNLFFGDER